jgi:hypothetical protein
MAERGVKLWRFLDFTKYVSMLDQGALFFTRADQLADPFEGAYARPNRVQRNHDEQRRFKRRMLLNCWHQNDHESAAMWRLYLKSEDGVAVQSTLERLERAFADDEQVRVAAVKYVDYERDCIPDDDEIAPFFHKRRAFEYERELRVLRCSDTPLEEPGRYFETDLGSLIERVVVSPTAEAWFAGLVSSVTQKYGFSWPVEPSELDRDPAC